MEENSTLTKNQKAKNAKQKMQPTKKDLVCPDTSNPINIKEYFNYIYDKKISFNNLKSDTAGDAYMMLEDFEYNLGTLEYHLSDTDAAFSKSKNISLEELDNHPSLKRFGDYFISQYLSDVLLYDENEDCTITRALQFSRILLLKDRNHPIGNHIFLKDKHKYAIGLGFKNGIAYHAASEMKVMPNGSGFIRFNGSNHGQTAYARYNKEKNLKIIKLIMTGSETGDLRCIKTNEKLNNAKELFHDGTTTTYNFAGHLHHVKHNGRVQGSFEKSSDPSQLLVKAELSEKEILELLACVVLRSDQHSIYHAMYDAKDSSIGKGKWDANVWISYRKNGLTDFIPYCWESENNFNHVINKLGLSITWAELQRKLFW